MKNAYAILLTLAFTSANATQTNQPGNSIDSMLEACLGEDSTTSHQVNCAYLAYDSWNKELNKVYKQLMAKLGPAEQSALLASQRNWIIFRDSEFAAIDSIYYANKQGTMYYSMRVIDRALIVKSRALQLCDYLDLLENG